MNIVLIKTLLPAAIIMLLAHPFWIAYFGFKGWLDMYKNANKVGIPMSIFSILTISIWILILNLF